MLISRLNRRIRKNPIKNGRRLAAIHCDGIETARDDGRRRRRRYGGDEGEKKAKPMTALGPIFRAHL